ncbi:hypothetical protein SF23_12280 [Streptomyces sp. MBRL 10]|nr:hypothetical protein SF23_12280 [Streptomyces sp. MBRL 10]
MTPEERSLRARLAAHVSWAATPDPASRTAKARAAADSKFEREAREMHPNASDEHIARVAKHLRSAHFSRMALKAAARRRNSATPNAA